MNATIHNAKDVVYTLSNKAPEFDTLTTTRFKIEGYDEPATLSSGGELLRLSVGSEVSLTMADGTTIIATAIEEAD